VFIAGDLLWYPVEGHPEIRQAPDALAAFGRLKGHRGSYQQWQEGGIAPQVVFEILSPGNRPREMVRKFQFYERYGVEEYYVYDPDHNLLDGWQRRGDKLVEIDTLTGWKSPRLGIRFELAEDTLRLYRPDCQPFLTFVELDKLRQEAVRQAELARQWAEQARQQVEQARQETNQARQQAEQARQETSQARRQAEQAQQQANESRNRAQRLADQLRALGLKPDA
jgi:hypothetical protein